MTSLAARSLFGAVSLVGLVASGPAMAGPLATIVINESYVGLPSDPGFQSI